MARKLRIALDMDEVMVDTYGLWLELYNRDWNDDRTKSDIKGWNVHTWVKPECGEKIYGYLNRVGFFLGMRPIDGAVTGVKRLVDAGHDVVVATATPRNSRFAYEEKQQWLRDHMPFLDINGFCSVHRKELIAADVLFDDGAHNLADFPGIAVCMDRPWNKGEDLLDIRCGDWEEFWYHIRALSERDDYHKTISSFSQERLQKHREREGWRYEQG